MQRTSLLNVSDFLLPESGMLEIQGTRAHRGTRPVRDDGLGREIFRDDDLGFGWDGWTDDRTEVSIMGVERKREVVR